MCSFRRNCSLSSLGGDNVIKLLFLVHSSLVSSKLLSSNLTGLLILGSDTSSDQLQHSLLERGESGNLPDDFSNSGGSLGNASLLGDWSGLPWRWGSGNSVSVVEADEKSGLVISLTHLSLLPRTNKN